MPTDPATPPGILVNNSMSYVTILKPGLTSSHNGLY